MARIFESVKIGSEYLKKVRAIIKESKHTLCGYIELAIEEKISRDKQKSK